MPDKSDRPGKMRPVQGLSQEEEAEQRRARRLATDLGINPAGVQVIIRLRRRVVGLTAQVEQLEDALRVERGHTEARLAQYRRKFFEGVWEDAL